MALIVCKNCGKNISDTTENCIHCGTPVKESLEQSVLETEENTEKAEAVEVKEAKKEEKSTRKNYLFLSDDEQVKLEEEFWEYDKEAFEWYRKIYRKKYMDIPLMLISVVALAACGLFMNLFVDFSSKFSMTFGVLGTILCFLAAVTGFVLVGFGTSISAFTRKKERRQQFIYQKRFQRWLREKKNLDFMPTVFRNGEESIFESVDIDNETF